MNCFDRFFLCCYQKNSFWLEASHLSFDHCINQSSVWRNIKLFQTNMYPSQDHWIFFNGCIILFFLSVMMPSKIFVECKHLADSFFFLFKQLLYVVWRLKLYCFPVNKMVHVSTTCFCHCMFLLSSLLSIALMFCIFISKTTVTF